MPDERLPVLGGEGDVDDATAGTLGLVEPNEKAWAAMVTSTVPRS
jgi:hypothetical protein